MPHYKFTTFGADIPEMSDDTAARRAFEQYTGGAQSSKVQIAMGAIGGAIAGIKGGPPGIFIGALLGTLGGFWRSKSYRLQVYAQLDAMGLIRKRRTRYRGVWTGRNSQFVFTRYPYADLTALVIVPLLQEHYPNLSVAELTRTGQDSQRALIKFRQENPDMPISLAAEIILAYYGIIRNQSGVFALAVEPATGEQYQTPPAQGPTLPTPDDRPTEDATGKPNYLLYAGIGIIAALIIARR